jgi:hypothetical protein
MSDFDSADTDGIGFDSLTDGSAGPAADDPGSASGGLWTQSLQPRFGGNFVVNPTEPASMILVPGSSEDAAIAALESQGITAYGAMTGADGTVEINPLTQDAAGPGDDGEE